MEKVFYPLLPPLNADKIHRHQGETICSLPLLVFDDKKRRHREDLFLTPLVPELSFPAHAAFFQV